MDSMLGSDKNLRGDKTHLGLSLRDNPFSISYKKTDKLITALYMVTDIMDIEEPIRFKLRTLGAEILSDILSIKFSSNVGLNSIGQADLHSINKKLAQILYFLEIGSTVGMISEMNAGILKKEFLELNRSIKDFRGNNILAELFTEEEINETNVLNNKGNSNGHIPIRHSTRLGVQKASTFMKALSDKMASSPLAISQINKPIYKINDMKDKRRQEILSIIKDKSRTSENFDGLTITDIKNSAKGALTNCGEKTLQRELVAMVGDGILNKKGEKRWSRYF